MHVCVYVCHLVDFLFLVMFPFVFPVELVPLSAIRPSIAHLGGPCLVIDKDPPPTHCDAALLLDGDFCVCVCVCVCMCVCVDERMSVS